LGETLKPIVIYSSRGGNTHKVAEAIASELGCESVKISRDNAPSTGKLNDYDLVFVGTGIVAANMYGELENYLENLNLEGSKRFGLFLTWGGAAKSDQPVIRKLKTILQSKGHVVSENVFECFGGRSYILIRRGHPNNQDLQDAKAWAKKQATQ
jgi:flavodoxin